MRNKINITPTFFKSLSYLLVSPCIVNTQCLYHHRLAYNGAFNSSFSSGKVFALSKIFSPSITYYYCLSLLSFRYDVIIQRYFLAQSYKRLPMLFYLKDTLQDKIMISIPSLAFISFLSWTIPFFMSRFVQLKFSCITSSKNSIHNRLLAEFLPLFHCYPGTRCIYFNLIQ